MSDRETIMKLARQRAEQLRVPYGGCVTPREAHTLLQADDVRLVDVRTRAELDWVGRIPGAIEVEWNSWPGSVPNPDFLAELRRQASSEQVLLFICRSGARSHAAAVAAGAGGFTQCYNVLEGFEGDRDADGHRGTQGGWRFAGLPWVQG